MWLYPFAFFHPIRMKGHRCTRRLAEVGGTSSGQGMILMLAFPCVYKPCSQDFVPVGLSPAKWPLPEASKRPLPSDHSATCSYARPWLCSLPAPRGKKVSIGAVVLTSDCPHHPSVQIHAWKPEGDVLTPENKPRVNVKLIDCGSSVHGSAATQKGRPFLLLKEKSHRHESPIPLFVASLPFTDILNSGWSKVPCRSRIC